nr:E3 ubiquitin-protein ligase SPL2-like isoform X1 [Physcomitrium patens]XP_024392965.1 E3 ubiquitin-protein ligase SPL2-like isoform X1 [Physcomitrium patens]XP_024392966.1 E3 ubiquitin-protein ligase SPL2-like isoform X1 [Physcomitrium patens]XP_024392967.1 E3 ubiquitin-protein ligase SPL2-like isoform X1 [Physcomitrium patens]XP_024392968.1 E3 ubiquitin-protein ligase SPL2-like isoform X1 [Physcomitrium patens]|eukprot:XP_024392964.1 E3 ubiquitin-protein ligase SPL2-like isoform X1 [Physcomitrella patens]
MAGHEDELCAALMRLALAGDGLVMGVGMTVLAFRTWIKFWSHSKALKDIKDTPVTRIADLRTLVEEPDVQAKEKIRTPEKQISPPHQDIEVFATRSKVKMPSRPWMVERLPIPSLETKQEKLVIVRGRVQTKAFVESEGDQRDAEALIPLNVPEKAVFVERTQTYVLTEMSNFLGWITQKDLVKFTRQVCLYNQWRGILRLGSYTRALLGSDSLKDQVLLSRRKVPFVLAETEAHWSFRPSDMAVYVHINLDESQHPIPLVTVHHQLHPVPASSYTLFQAMFGRRYPVGLLDEEKILPLGAEITAVGVLHTAPDGTPVVKSSKRLPIFLTEFTREQLLVELASSTKVLFWMGVAVSTVAAGVLGYSLVKNWTRWKQRQQQRQSQNNSENRQNSTIEDEAENFEDIPDGELCVVCLLRRRRAAFIYCGHRVCCMGCAERVEHGANPRCPVCRQSVTGIVRVYDS